MWSQTRYLYFRLMFQLIYIISFTSSQNLSATVHRLAEFIYDYLYPHGKYSTKMSTTTIHLSKIITLE